MFFDAVYKKGTQGVKHQAKSVQYGRSMIEMLGVLALIGVLSVGGITGYSKAMTKFKINKAIEQISQIVANTKTLYAQQTSYDGLNTQSAISMGVIPSEMGTSFSCTWISCPTISTPFNGGLYIEGSYKTFGLLYEAKSIDECIAIASANWGNATSSGLIGITIGEITTAIWHDISPRNTCTGETTQTYICPSAALPIPPATASTHCKRLWANETSDGVVIGFKFQ